LSASSLKLVNVTNLLRFPHFALKRPKIDDFPKDNGIFQRVLRKSFAKKSDISIMRTLFFNFSL